MFYSLTTLAQSFFWGTSKKITFIARGYIGGIGVKKKNSAVDNTRMSLVRWGGGSVGAVCDGVR